MTVLFFILAGLLVYVYVGYPLLLLPFSLLNRRRPLGVGGDLPSLAVLIPVHNEEAAIRAKIANMFASDYPVDRLEILVGADACTDGTLRELASVTDRRLRVVPIETRSGKGVVLNRLAALTQAEILVMSDADVTVDPEALRLLAAPFADSRVGAVCGRRSHHVSPLTGLRGPARLYNLYESTIKRGEGRLHRVLGADGSLYALRKSLFRPIPPDVPDDFVSVLRVIEAGARALYEKDAVSYERLAADSSYQFTRKRRTVARGVRGLWHVRALLNPMRFPLTSFLLLSHKVLRWGTPLFLVGLFLMSVTLAHRPFFLFVLLGQAAFYLMAWGGAAFPAFRDHRLVQTIRYFVVVNAATAAGLWDVLRGRSWSTWATQAETGVS